MIVQTAPRPSCCGARRRARSATSISRSRCRGSQRPRPRFRHRPTSTRGWRSTTPAFATGQAPPLRVRDRARAARRRRRRRDDPGMMKEGRDLELPPWNKGRYGTAIGRAVHAVLQTVDLATGAGLADLAAAQAAAEGVLGHEATIARARAVGAWKRHGARRVRGGVLARDLRRGPGGRAHARGLRRSRVPPGRRDRRRSRRRRLQDRRDRPTTRRSRRSSRTTGCRERRTRSRSRRPRVSASIAASSCSSAQDGPTEVEIAGDDLAAAIAEVRGADPVVPRPPA